MLLPHIIGMLLYDCVIGNSQSTHIELLTHIIGMLLYDCVIGNSQSTHIELLPHIIGMLLYDCIADNGSYRIYVSVYMMYERKHRILPLYIVFRERSRKNCV